MSVLGPAAPGGPGCRAISLQVDLEAAPSSVTCMERETKAALSAVAQLLFYWLLKVQLLASAWTSSSSPAGLCAARILWSCSTLKVLNV